MQIFYYGHSFIIDVSTDHDTTKKGGLHPTSSDDRGACLVTLELVACGEMQLAQVCRAVVGQRMQLEPRNAIWPIF
jgi:hypothetical protein